MKFYELTLLISPEISETELNSLREKITSFIQEEKGILVETNRPIKKKLFSPIRKKNQTILLTLNFQLPSLTKEGETKDEALENLEKKLKAENQILRYMILKKPPITFKKRMIEEKPIISRKKVVEGKVEIKEIEKKLEEILGE